MKKIYIALNLVALSLCAGDELTKEFCEQFMPENPVILEAGIYNAGDTCDMAQRWPQATIYGFEPVPQLFKENLIKVARYENVQLFPYALSDESGFAKFYISDASDWPMVSSSLLEPADHLEVYPEVSFKEPIEVPKITLDEWAEKYGVDHIDFLWLDMQGGEYDMLQASKKILPTVKAIYTEVNFIELYKGCRLYPEYKAWLESQGFTEIRMQVKHETWGDALFVRQ